MADYMESANKINTMAASAVSEDEFKKVANKVSFITIVQNVLLSVFKLFAGIFAHSNAMISDAVHSASDVFSTIIVIIGVKLASKESDKEHPYGHERMECVAAIVLATVLAVTGLGIGWSAIQSIAKESTGVVVVPGVLALVAAVVSILTKEGMYWYTRFHAKKNRFQCLNGRCMASSLRCTFLSWCISWYRSFQSGISVNGSTRQSCYMRFY